MTKWDSYFLSICNAVASNSRCLSRQIGAILVRDKSIIATGYNGPARNIPHCGVSRLLFDEALGEMFSNKKLNGNLQICPRQQLGFKSGEGLEWCTASHAEQNCIANAARLGISTFNSTLYMNTQTPCKNCLSILINAGVREIVVTDDKPYDRISNFILHQSRLIVRTFE